ACVLPAGDGIRGKLVAGVQTCAPPICDRADLVLAVANSIAPVARRVRPRRRNPLAVLVATFRALVNRRLRIVLLSLLGLLVVGRSEERRVGKERRCRRWPGHGSAKCSE